MNSIDPALSLEIHFVIPHATRFNAMTHLAPLAAHQRAVVSGGNAVGQVRFPPKSLEGKGSGVKLLYGAIGLVHILHLAPASLSSSSRPHHITRQLLCHCNSGLVISHHSSDL